MSKDLKNKFNIGQEVFFLPDPEVCQFIASGIICTIQMVHINEQPFLEYLIQPGKNMKEKAFCEKELFATKAEAKNEVVRILEMKFEFARQELEKYKDWKTNNE